MMDGSPLYPHCHHPVRGMFAVGNVVVFPTTQVSRLDAPVRYYFTKFNILAEFEEAENVTRAALGPLRPRYGWQPAPKPPFPPAQVRAPTPIPHTSPRTILGDITDKLPVGRNS